MQRDTIFSVCFLLVALLTFFAGCTRAPVVVEQAKPTVEVTPAPTEKVTQLQLPVKRGSLVIISEPIGANVKVDDNPMGTTPLALKDVPAGAYRIEIELPHYEVFRSEVDVKDKQMAEVKADLKLKPGALEIRSEPVGAKVQVDGKAEGVTPYSEWVASNVVHKITVSAEGYYPETREVLVKPEGKEALSLTLKRIPTGTLEIRSEPVGASIWLDGKNVGVAPYKATLTADREHEIILSAKGYEFKSQKVTVKPEEIQTVSITLEKVADKPGQIVSEKDGAVMMLIPAGDFLMGSPEGEGDDEDPQHTVFLDAFYIDRYEVTNAQYKLFMDATGHSAPKYWDDPRFNAPDHPVVGVTWYDAQAYCQWAGKRLPTEAEWKKAARGGLVGKKFPWGDTISHNDANYDGTGERDKWEYTSPVGSFPPNGYGLYDMAGNVWEWCADWYGANYYSISPRSNPKGPDSGEHKVLRGGSWGHSGIYLRTAYRDSRNPVLDSNFVGFRCVQ